MKRVVFNQKGGVGKTSIACNLAAIGAAMGYRTLVVDLDVQGNTTHYLVGAVDADAHGAVPHDPAPVHATAEAAFYDASCLSHEHVQQL